MDSRIHEYPDTPSSTIYPWAGNEENLTFLIWKFFPDLLKAWVKTAGYMFSIFKFPDLWNNYCWCRREIRSRGPGKKFRNWQIFAQFLDPSTASILRFVAVTHWKVTTAFGHCLILGKDSPFSYFLIGGSEISTGLGNIDLSPISND